MEAQLVEINFNLTDAFVNWDLQDQIVQRVSISLVTNWQLTPVWSQENHCQNTPNHQCLSNDFNYTETAELQG